MQKPPQKTNPLATDITRKYTYSPLLNKRSTLFLFPQ